MRTRSLALLGSLALVLAAAQAAPEPPDLATAAPAQKKQPRKKGAVDGALWSFVATDRQGKQIRFRYRAADLVLYDPDTGAEIGKSEPIEPGVSRVTFDSDSDFPAEFVIRRGEGPARWSGKADYDGRTWTIQLRGILD